MKLSFDNWVISKDTALLGYQYDNESQELWVTGDLPQGWTWDALIQDGSHYDVWPLTLAERGAYITLNDENLAVPGSFYIQIRGTKGEQVQHTNIVSVYISRSLVGPGTWPTLPTEFSQAEKAIKELNAHPPIPGENGFWLLWNLETSSYEESQLPVPVGPAGPANVLEMGEVTTLAPQEAATAELTGESPHQVLHLGLPQGKTGEPGPTGPTPQLTVGEVATLDPEEPATAELSGTPEKPVLNLGIPQGKTGQPGPIGNPGPANTLQVGQVATLAPDQPATAEITGASPTQTLNLGLPQGKTGPTGATPELTMGEVTTLDPGEPARAELSGTPEAPVLSLGLPQGQPGKDGVQLEDEAITSTAAWSSRKIVDTLCPAFSVSGNPVTCNPVEDYPLSAVVTLEPKQAGSGDPSPENIRPISGYDSVTVTQSKDGSQVKQITLTLPATIYGGTVDAVTGEGEKTWEFVEFDGTEDWILYPDKLENCITLCLSISRVQIGFFTSVCNCFKNVMRSWRYDTPWQYSDHDSNNYKYFVVPISEIPDLDSWKSYLATQAAAGTPVTVACQLATPEPFEVTPHPIPALPGVNTLYTDGDSLTVTGRRDLVSALEDLQTTMTAVTTLISEGELT